MANLLNECNIRNLENAADAFANFCSTANDNEITEAVEVIKALSKLNIHIYECVNAILWSINQNAEKESDIFRNSEKMLNAALK